MITAVAVLLVSTTCTSAGCLLRSTAAPQAHEGVEASVESCCAVHLGKQGPSHPADHRCPLCQHTTMLGKAVDPPQYHVMLTVIPFACCAEVATAQAPSQFHSNNAADATFAHPPPTLFALRCAFLN